MSLVYEPSDDSFLIERVISSYSKNKNVLDMCTGSGILAKKAVNSKARSVTAVDINKKALDTIKNKKIIKIHSDLFKKVDGKFDLIVCNPPYLPNDQEEDNESKLATSGGKRGDEFILKFIKQSVKHLAKNGIIILLVSSLTPGERIEKLLEKLNLSSKIIAEKKIFFEKLEVLEIKNNYLKSRKN